MIRQFLNSDYSFSSTNLPLKSGSIIGKPSFSTDSLITSPPDNWLINSGHIQVFLP